MGRPMSVDLRERVVPAVDGWMSRRKAAAKFEVSISSGIRWTSRKRRLGTLRSEPQGGDTRSRRIEAHAPVILEAVETTPDITLAELRERLAGRGLAVAASTLHRFFARQPITRKKRTRVWPSRTARTS